MDPHPVTVDQRMCIFDLLSLPAPAYYTDLLLAGGLQNSTKLLLGSRATSPVTLSSDLVDFAVYKLRRRPYVHPHLPPYRVRRVLPRRLRGRASC